MHTAVHFSSEKTDWETPQWFFDRLNEEFEFELDVCASAENKKCDAFFDEKRNGLVQDWGRRVCWMNPPYGREIVHFVRKAFESACRGATVVCLLPARTDTAWWGDYVTKADEIRFYLGRLKFNNHENSAPFPSAVAIFTPRRAPYPRVFWASLRELKEGGRGQLFLS